MKYLFVALALLLAPPTFAVTSIEPELPFEPFVFSDVERQLNELFLGDLADYPEMVEFELTEETTIPFRMLQAETTSVVPYSLILIRVNGDGLGVTEVRRVNGAQAEWLSERDANLGLSLLVSDTYTVTLEPGLYRLEISTPVNSGAYALQFGSEYLTGGYFENIGAIIAVHRHFANGIFSALASPYLHYPLGTVVIVIIIGVTWAYRRRIVHAP